MPAGNLTIVDRFNRLVAIKEAIDEGKDLQQIADELNMPIATVRRNARYIEDLKVSDLTPEEVGKRRSELYLELLEAADEAKILFDKYKEKSPKSARTFFMSWMETIEMRMKLFGLNNISPSTMIQINNPVYKEPDKIDADVGKRIADMIKREHERKVSDMED